MLRFATEVEFRIIEKVPLALNYTNGCVIGLTKDAYDQCLAVQSGKENLSTISKTDSALYDAFESKGFLSCSKPDNGINTAYFHVTQRCNLNCVGCYSNGLLRNAENDPSLDMLDKALCFLAEQGTQRLVISGGEPFLREDLPDIVEKAKRKYNIPCVDIITNGLIRPRFEIGRLTNNVNSVAISFDGSSSDVPSHLRGDQNFDALLAFFERLSNASIEASILPTIHPRNIDEIPAYLELAKRLSAKISFSILSCSACHDSVPSFSDDDLRAVLKTIRSNRNEIDSELLGLGISAKRNCGAGYREVSIDADGEVYPCHMLHASRYRMGNAFFDDGGDVMTSVVAREFSNLNVSQFEQCGQCKVSHLCGGGCRARALANGNIDGVDPYCTLSKEHFEWLLRSVRTAVEERRLA